LSILFIPLFANAEVLGISDLGLCHPKYDYKGFILQFSGSPVIVSGWLDNTFNPKGCPNAKKLMSAKKPLVLRVHILNSPGLRNKRLELHEIHAGLSRSQLDKKIRSVSPDVIIPFSQRLQRLRDLLSKRKGPMVLFLSPCLECDLSKPARVTFLMLTSLYFPNAILVDNPLKGSCVSGVVCERHGDENSGGIVDLDGIPLTEVNIKLWKRHTKAKYIRYAWLPCNNGLKKGQKWVPPTKRVNFCSAKERKLLKNFLLMKG
jgi:hypothetical protein